MRTILPKGTLNETLNKTLQSQIESSYPGGLSEIGFLITFSKKIKSYEQKSKNNTEFTLWTDLIYNPLTGAMGIKQDYTGTIVISIFNKNGNVFRRITCKDCFPLKAIDPMELDYLNGTTLYEISMTWAVDYWEDLFT